VSRKNPRRTDTTPASTTPAHQIDDETYKAVAAATFKKLHKNAYVSDTDVLTGLDEDTEQRLSNAKLWTVVALCALSSAALGKLNALHSAAMEEDRLAKRLRAVADHLDSLSVQLSTQTKYGCLLLTNMPELQVRSGFASSIHTLG
jgi:hypothetical protein